MKRLVEKVHEEWAEAKQKAADKCRYAGRIALSIELENCKMFEGEETLEQLCAKMFSPRGREFLTRFGFPTIEVYREFKKYNPERFGVYIDCGHIRLKDEPNAFIVGNTIAEVEYEATRLNCICAVCGAAVKGVAKGFSVVKIEKDKTASVDIEADDNAVVI